MWSTCDRCRQRIVTDASVVQLQHGAVKHRKDGGMPRMQPGPVVGLHTLCRPCGVEVAQTIQQFIDPS